MREDDKQRIPTEGDVIRVKACGPFKANEGSDLVVLFLGAADEGGPADVPAYLGKLGFQRTHAFELVLSFRTIAQSPPEDWTTKVIFTAGSPAEAVAAAVRFARWCESQEADSEVDTLALSLTRLGPIGPAGRPHNGRGRTFAMWAAGTGRRLEDLLAPPAAGPTPG